MVWPPALLSQHRVNEGIRLMAYVGTQRMSLALAFRQTVDRQEQCGLIGFMLVACHRLAAKSSWAIVDWPFGTHIKAHVLLRGKFGGKRLEAVWACFMWPPAFRLTLDEGKCSAAIALLRWPSSSLSGIHARYENSNLVLSGGSSSCDPYRAPLSRKEFCSGTA
jgi:hypothetical protein